MFQKWSVTLKPVCIVHRCSCQLCYQCVLILFLYCFRGGLPSLGDIENVHKKRAHDRESRLSTVMVSERPFGVCLLIFLVYLYSLEGHLPCCVFVCLKSDITVVRSLIWKTRTFLICKLMKRCAFLSIFYCICHLDIPEWQNCAAWKWWWYSRTTMLTLCTKS